MPNNHIVSRCLAGTDTSYHRSELSVPENAERTGAGPSGDSSGAGAPRNRMSLSNNPPRTHGFAVSFSPRTRERTITRSIAIPRQVHSANERWTQAVAGSKRRFRGGSRVPATPRMLSNCNVSRCSKYIDTSYHRCMLMRPETRETVSFVQGAVTDGPSARPRIARASQIQPASPGGGQREGCAGNPNPSARESENVAGQPKNAKVRREIAMGSSVG